MSESRRFSKIIATGYYDGPTDGLVADSDGALFRFRLLDWDDGQDLRVFSLAALGGITWEEAVRALGQGTSPTWPIWVVPSPLERVGEEFIRHVEAKATLVAVVAAPSLLHEIGIWHELSKADAQLTETDWFGLLGLSRHQRNE